MRALSYSCGRMGPLCSVHVELLLHTDFWPQSSQAVCHGSLRDYLFRKTKPPELWLLASDIQAASPHALSGKKRLCMRTRQ